MLKIEQKLDISFSKLAKGRKCHYCCAEKTELHHLERRSNKAFRWTIENCIPVCRICHRKIHEGKLQEPELTFEPIDLKEYLSTHFLSYNQFLEQKAKELGVKIKDGDFETVRKNRNVCEKVKEYRRKMWKEAYKRRKEWLKAIAK